MGYRVVDARSFEGRRKPLGAEVAPAVLRFNQFDSQPGQEGFQHDERASGQEEVYVALRGSGVLRVDGDEVGLEPGLYVLVGADSTRQVVAGDEGLSYLVFGAVTVPQEPAAGSFE
jgi:quercetin dioxygenase-like cupin family protein